MNQSLLDGIEIIQIVLSGIFCGEKNLTEFSNMERYCPTCDKVLIEFNDVIDVDREEHHGRHRTCGKIVILRVKNLKRKI